jgi:plastocyanin
MMTENMLSRRTILKTSGIALAGLAGCTGAPSNGSGASTPTPTEENQHTEEEGHEEEGHEEEGGHGEDEHGHDEAVGDPVELAEANMVSRDDGEHFEPHVVRVTKGGTVRWTNESGTHSTTAYSQANDKVQLMPDGATAWDSGILTEKGATFEHTFETEGVYHYYCTPHESLGMIGSVIVGEPDAHGQPALEEPPEDMPDRVREKIKELNAMCNEALGHTHSEETTTESGDHHEG